MVLDRDVWAWWGCTHHQCIDLPQFLLQGPRALLLQRRKYPGTSQARLTATHLDCYMCTCTGELCSQHVCLGLAGVVVPPASTRISATCSGTRFTRKRTCRAI